MRGCVSKNVCQKTCDRGRMSEDVSQDVCHRTCVRGCVTEDSVTEDNVSEDVYQQRASPPGDGAEPQIAQIHPKDPSGASRQLALPPALPDLCSPVLSYCFSKI